VVLLAHRLKSIVMIFSIGVFLSFLRSKELLKLSLGDVETYFCVMEI